MDKDKSKEKKTSPRDSNSSSQTQKVESVKLDSRKPPADVKAGAGKPPMSPKVDSRAQPTLPSPEPTHLPTHIHAPLNTPSTSAINQNISFRGRQAQHHHRHSEMEKGASYFTKNFGDNVYTKDFLKIKRAMNVITTVNKFKKNKPNAERKYEDTEVKAPDKVDNGLWMKFFSGGFTVPASVPQQRSTHSSTGQGDMVSATADAPQEAFTIVNAALSGYVNVTEFAHSVVSDPNELRSLVQDMTNRLYIFFIFLVVAAAMLNGINVFILRYMDPVFAKRFLRKILMDSDLNPYGILGTMAALIILGLWGCFMLVEPYAKNPIMRVVRWMVPGAFLGYIVYGVIIQIYDCRNLHNQLKVAMMADLKKGINLNADPNGTPIFNKTLIEQLSQEYLGCCGVNGKDDWKLITKRSIPPTCCKEHQFRGCHIQDLDHPAMAHTIWPMSCLKKEYLWIYVIMLIVEGIEIFCVLSTILASVILYIVLKHTNELDVEHVHPFGTNY